MSKQPTHTTSHLDPLTRARGLGSSKTGTETWLAELVAASALFLLMLYVLASFTFSVVFGGNDYAGAVAWLHHPVNGVAMISMLGVGIFYGSRGVISGLFEDYVHHPVLNLFGVTATKYAAVLLAVIGITAVLKIMLGA